MSAPLATVKRADDAARAVISAMGDVAHQTATRCANEAAAFDADLERRWDAIARAIESALKGSERV